MKIRTDFVTNSSSSSFVTYRITPGEDDEPFMQLRILLDRLRDKYDQRYIMNTYDGGEPLEYNSNTEIKLTMWTPGLSDNYLDDVHDGERSERVSEFHEFARGDNNYPPEAVIAFAALFGGKGDNMGFLSKLTHTTKLLDKDGLISKSITTDITRKEAARLNELLEKVCVDKVEIVGGTD